VNSTSYLGHFARGIGSFYVNQYRSNKDVVDASPCGTTTSYLVDLTYKYNCKKDVSGVWETLSNTVAGTPGYKGYNYLVALVDERREGKSFKYIYL
jgi:hypothetical protein